MTETTQKLKVFISYSRADMHRADELVAALESADFAVLIDRRDLPYGEQWQQVLFDYIRDCDTVVFLVSLRSIESQWVRWELQHVTELRKRLLPVVIERCPPETLPPAVASVELLPKMGTFALETEFPDLVQALNTNRVWVMEATKLQSRTFDWIHSGRRSALLLRGSALDAAERWREARPNVETISGGVLDFLLSSRQGATRRQRSWLIGSFIVALGASGLALTAYLQRVEATRQRAEAVRQSNAAIAQSAAVTSLASDSDPVRGLLLADEALRRTDGKPTATTLAAHRNAVARFGSVRLIDAASLGLPISDVAAPHRGSSVFQLSNDRRWLLGSTEDFGAIDLWLMDLTNADPETTFRVIDTGLIGRGTADGVGTPTISRTGRFMAAAPDRFAHPDLGALIFDLRDGRRATRRLAKSAGERSNDSGLQFSDDERWLTDGQLLWNLDGGTPTIAPRVLPTSGSDEVFFTRNSSRIGVPTVQDSHAILRTWSLATLKDERRETFESVAAARVAHPDVAWPSTKNYKDHVAVSPDGRWTIAWADVYLSHWTVSRAVVRHFDERGHIQLERRIPDVTPGAPEKDDESVQGSIVDSDFSADSRWLVTTGKALQVWNLTETDPFKQPFAEISVPGTRVAIDPSGRWIATFGSRLQIWDLALEVPGAFPVNPRSTPFNGDDPKDVALGFARNGTWLFFSASGGVEVFDLRLDRTVRDAGLAGGNLSSGEWRSVFGDAPYQKTFPDLPLSPSGMKAADDVARAGDVAGAARAYKAILVKEPGIRLDPQRRAETLAAQLSWEQGEQEVHDQHCEDGRRLLRQAKRLNPSIPWDPDARTAQLCAQQYHVLLNQLRGRKLDESSETVPIKAADAAARLGALREVINAYPLLLFDAREADVTAAPGEGLYQFGLRVVAEGTRDTARNGLLEDALQLRLLLVSQRWPQAPAVEELSKLAQDGLTSSFGRYLTLPDWERARETADRMATINKPLGVRMQLALNVLTGFDPIADRPDRPNPVSADELNRLGTLLNNVATSGDPDAVFAFVRADFLNAVCWRGTTARGLAALVLPICEAAVRLASDAQRAEFRDSRGVAYAAVGRLDAALDDFKYYLSSGPKNASAQTRRQWVAALEGCLSTPTMCDNPLADPTILRTIK